MSLVSIHQQHVGPLNDDDYCSGRLGLLVVGNRCRLLDGRRTPGTIEAMDLRTAMFTFRIAAYEDEGKCWELPAESVTRFQFHRDSVEAPQETVRELRRRIKLFERPLNVSADSSIREKTDQALRRLTEEAKTWLRDSKVFLNSGGISNIMRSENLLTSDLTNYMGERNLLMLEKETAKSIVLNPYSGEWIKGMWIMLGVLGIREYRGTVPRTEEIFEGPGREELRKEYILNRLGFVRAAFELSGIDEVLLYRGMATESKWQIGRPVSMTSWTFSREVAESFADLGKRSRFINSYIIKRTFPVSKLFMTFIETSEMNEQYHEAEAMVLTSDEDACLW